MTNDTRTRLIAEISAWSDGGDGGDILPQLDKPRRRGAWWGYLPAEIQQLWEGLPLDAKLVAVLWALHNEGTDFRDPCRR
jgi:hypothetical protein